MTAFEIIILVILYAIMFGFVLQNYQYNTIDGPLRIKIIIAAIFLAWLAPISFGMYIHQDITKFLDN